MPSFAAVIISPPSRGREDLVGRDRVEGSSLRRRHGAGREVPEQVVGHERERRLPERDVERAAAALVQRGEDREGRVHARRVVDQRHADPNAVATLFAGDADHAGGCLEQRVVSRERPLGALASVGRDRAVNQPRVAPAELARPEAELLRQPRPQALDDDVGTVREPMQHVAPAPQVERERALPRVHRDEERPEPTRERRSPEARLVARRGLDLDHVGAERAEQLRAGRARVRGGHVDDADSVEGGEGHAPIIVRIRRAGPR